MFICKFFIILFIMLVLYLRSFLLVIINMTLNFSCDCNLIQLI